MKRTPAFSSKQQRYFSTVGKPILQVICPRTELNWTDTTDIPVNICCVYQFCGLVFTKRSHAEILKHMASPDHMVMLNADITRSTAKASKYLLVKTMTMTHNTHRGRWHRQEGGRLCYDIADYPAISFLGPRGPLGTPSLVSLSVRPFVRKKNLNHFQSLLNHPTIRPDPWNEILM